MKSLSYCVWTRRRVCLLAYLLRVVVSYHSDTGYIDLSKRRVSPEDITKCEERYMKSKTVASIMRHVASKVPAIGADGQEITPSAEAEEKERETKRSRRAHKKEGIEDDVLDEPVGLGGPANSSEEERLEQLYEQIAWPLGKIYGHTYDAFKLALTCVLLWSLIFRVV